MVMKQTEIQDTADLLKALGEFNRLSLVYRLCECPQPQNAMCLCDCCSVDASVVSRHLKTLAQAGILKLDKKGRERTYSLDRANVVNQLRALATKIETSL
jgi:ArsR family transcriptional regulator